MWQQLPAPPTESTPLLRVSIINSYPLIDPATLIKDLRSVSAPCDDVTNLTHGRYHFILKPNSGGFEQTIQTKPITIDQTNNPKDTTNVAQALRMEMKTFTGIEVDFLLCKALFTFEKPNNWGSIFGRFTNLAAVPEFCNIQFNTAPAGYPNILYEPLSLNTVRVYYKQEIFQSEQAFSDDALRYLNKISLELSFVLEIDRKFNTVGNIMQGVSEVHMTQAVAVLKTDPVEGVRLIPVLKKAYAANKRLFNMGEQTMNHADARTYINTRYIALGLTVQEAQAFYPLLSAPENSCCTIL